MLAYYAGIVCQHTPLLRCWVATCALGLGGILGKGDFTQNYGCFCRGLKVPIDFMDTVLK